MVSVLISQIENLSFEYPSGTGAKLETSRFHDLKTQKFNIVLETLNQIAKRIQFLIPENSKDSILSLLRFLLPIMVRAGFGFLLMFLVLLLTLLNQHEMPLPKCLTACAVTAGILTIIFVASSTFRCVMILSIPSFATQQGRFVLFALIISILIGGPITSFSTNLGEFGKSAKCMSLTTVKQGKEIVENYDKTYNEMYKYLDYHVEKLKITKEYVDTQLKPIKDSLAEIGRHLESFKQFLHTTAEECHLTIEGARVSCVQKVEAQFTKCKNTFLRAVLVDNTCEVVWTVADICEPILNRKVVCAPLRLSEQLTEDVKAAMKVLEEQLSIEYGIVKEFGHQVIHTINATELEQKIRYHFEKALGKIITAMTVFKYLFMTGILWIPVKSYLFLRKVRRGLTTSPAPFLERFPEFNKRQRNQELWSQGLFLVFHMLFSLLILGIDYGCYWIHATMLALGDPGSLTIQSNYNLKLNVVVGQLLLMNPIVDFQNEYFKNLNLTTKQNYNFSSRTAECFPTPVSSSLASALIPILCLYFLVVVLLINGNRILKYRLRVIYFVIPDMKPTQDSSLIPY